MRHNIISPMQYMTSNACTNEYTVLNNARITKITTEAPIEFKPPPIPENVECPILQF